MTTLRAILSGGGTGGHIYPALAIADALKAEVPSAEILFIGAEGKMEMRRVPKSGYEIKGLPVAGFHRQLDTRNFSFPLKLIRSFAMARRWVKDFAPDVVVGTGGYASGPALAAAALQGVPVFLQEQNALPGVTNRLLGRVATSIFTAYPEAAKYFASAKTKQLGNPLRTNLAADRMPAKPDAVQHFKLRADRPTLLSFGGSLGAKKMNEALAGMASFWQENQQFQLIWQTGEGYYDKFSQTVTAQLDNVCCLPYLERMDLAYAAADLVSCRAGALSISELQLLGKPAILIPSPNVAGDHQTANALAVERTGAAVVVRDNQQVEQLPAVLSELLAAPAKLQSMAVSARALGRPNSAQQIASIILEHVGS
jgi:UDP-N-acetylglucosamine--N-acetylmuramyl-(pentapeptide) pyrophosphoryl-undecaprenol N-acetylglucosamine transferase